MGFLPRVSPETRSLVITVGVLGLAYVIFHWKYYYNQFYLDVLEAVHPRRQTLLPRTGCGLLVRCIICYYAYKAFKWLQQASQRRAEARRTLREVHGAARLAAANDAARMTSAEQLQDRTSKASAAAIEAKRQRQSKAASQEAARQGEASDPAAAGELDRAGGMRVWLERLQAQQNEAAVAAAATAAAANAIAAAGAATDFLAAADVTEAATVTATTAATPSPLPAAAAAAAADARAAAESSLSKVSDSAAGAASSSTATSGATVATAAAGSGAVSHGLRSSGNSMVSLQEAQAAEERQRQWLQQLSANPSLSPLKIEAMERERELKAQQDAEYEAALEADRRRAEELAAAEAAEAAEAAARAEAEAAAAAAEAGRRLRLEELKQRLRETLPAEPDREDETAVLVRVRLPDGCSHTRRFAAEAPVQQIRDWLQSLDSFPMWDSDRWCLVNSYPRRVLGRGPEQETVASTALGSKQVALFVQED